MLRHSFIQFIFVIVTGLRFCLNFVDCFSRIARMPKFRACCSWDIPRW